MAAPKWLALLILGWPAAELVTFIVVATLIGAGPAFGLLLLTSIAGALVLRYGGGAHVSRIRVALNDGGISGVNTDGAGFMILLAGILLLLPGFISDVLGLLLLVPVTRRWLGARLKRAFTGTEAAAPGTVDLERDQWRQVPDEQLEDRRDQDRNR
ncbi:MAG TPA: FxsA family protein [Pseudolabrys sp.]|nr:FxsA family protein [Pseudolabrys sp.]